MSIWQWLAAVAFVGAVGVVAGALTWCLTGVLIHQRAQRSFFHEMRRK